MMVVFSIFFGRLAEVPSDDVPYPIFSYCALLPWQLFCVGPHSFQQQRRRERQRNNQGGISRAWSCRFRR